MVDLEVAIDIAPSFLGCLGSVFLGCVLGHEALLGRGDVNSIGVDCLGVEDAVGAPATALRWSLHD